MHTLCPSLLVAIDGFKKRLSRVKVSSFHEAVCTGVVAANPDVVNMVSFHKIRKGFYESQAVICDNFVQATPSAKEVLVYPVAKTFGVLSS